MFQQFRGYTPGKKSLNDQMCKFTHGVTWTVTYIPETKKMANTVEYDSVLKKACYWYL